MDKVKELSLLKKEVLKLTGHLSDGAMDALAEKFNELVDSYQAEDEMNGPVYQQLLFI